MTAKHEIRTYGPDEEDDGWIGIWDRTNPSSVYSRVPNRFREALDLIPKSVRLLDEEELLKRTSPSAAIGEARLNFWDLFKHTSSRMRMSEVFKSRGTFYQMLEDPYKFMWFLTPPADFLTSQKSVLERSLEVLRKFVAGDNMWLETTTEKTDASGNTTTKTVKEINTKAIAEARKVMEAMTDRIHGAVAMNLKVQGQHKHLHASPAEKIQGMDVSQILNLGDAKPEVPSLTAEDVAEALPHKFNNQSFYGVDEKVSPEVPEDDLSEFMGDE